MQLPCAEKRAQVGLYGKVRNVRKRARVRRSVVLSKGPKREGWARDVVDGNLQSLCSSAVMSTINKRNIVR